MCRPAATPEKSWVILVEFNRTDDLTERTPRSLPAAQTLRPLPSFPLVFLPIFLRNCSAPENDFLRGISC